MYNLFRKSIILIAGFGLLFLSSCTSTIPPQIIEKDYITIDSIFPKERNTLLYLDFKENKTLIQGVLDSLSIEGAALNLVNESKELFLGFNEDITLGFDAIIKGAFSKWKIEFGLFLSFDWKKVKVNGIKYWKHKDGLNLYLKDNNLILVSNFDIVPLIKTVNNNFLDSPTESILLLMPVVNNELTQKLSNGFIKGGVKDLSISMNKVDDDYSLIGTLGFDSSGKAKGFSLLMKMFFKFILVGSSDKNIVKIGQEIDVKSVDNLVIVTNVTLNEIFLADLINNIVFLEGEADK